ncbi:hypothetical protein FQZ97_1051490 [compost metagenome]
MATSRSTSRWCETSVESWSCRSSRTTPSKSSSLRGVSSIESRIVWCRGGMPSHSSSSPAPSLPHTTAVAHDVVGRRMPTEESSSPVSELYVDDLPEPVAPAMATTVCRAESRSRPVDLSTAAATPSSSASSSRPRAALAAVSSPATLAPMAVPRVARSPGTFVASSRPCVTGVHPFPS